MLKLSELSEQDAPDSIKTIYEEIRFCTRAPMVALIYRHLATRPGVLQWAWGALVPIMYSGDLPDSAREMVSVASYPNIEPLPGEELRALGLFNVDVHAIRYVIAAYYAANPCNILATLCLIKILKESLKFPVDNKNLSHPIIPDLNMSLPVMPPMLDTSLLPKEVLSLRPKKALSVGLVPSLYRHLGHWPNWLKVVLEKSLIQIYESGEIEKYANELLFAAEKRVEILLSKTKKFNGNDGRPLGRESESLCKTLEAFVETIPTLIVMGEAFRNTLSKH